MKTVSIMVKGGVASAYPPPDGIRVIIKDYDVEGMTDEAELSEDSTGKYSTRVVSGKEEYEYSLSVTPREFDTILAALRGRTSPHTHAELETIASEHGEPLTPEEIDVLCERLNTTATRSRAGIHEKRRTAGKGEAA